MIIGIIDIGSNTIRLNVYDTTDNKFEILFSKKENVGLVSYVKKKKMTIEGFEKLERCLSRFKKMLESLHIDTYSAFATASLRNINNSDEAIDYIYDKLGIRIDLLSGAQEGRISFVGAIHHLDHSSGIYMDTGGASSEIILYDHKQIGFVTSLPVGSLNLYNKYVKGIIPTQDEIKSIQQRVIKELKSSEKSKNYFRCEHLAITGGSMRAVRSVMVQLKMIDHDEYEIKTSLLYELVDKLSKDPNETMHLFLKVKPDRVHTLFTGLLIITTVAKYTNCQTVQVSTNGVREGYLFEKYLGA